MGMSTQQSQIKIFGDEKKFKFWWIFEESRLAGFHLGGLDGEEGGGGPGAGAEEAEGLLRGDFTRLELGPTVSHGPLGLASVWLYN